MTTSTEIARKAMMHLRSGVVSVVDVYADNTSEAQILREALDSAANTIQSVYAFPNWQREATLSLSASQPNAALEGKFYDMPAGAYSVQRVINASPIPLCRYQEKLNLREEIPDPLKELFALRVAVEACPAMARDNNLKQQLLGEYMREIQSVQYHYSQQDRAYTPWRDTPTTLRWRVMSDGNKPVLFVENLKDYDTVYSGAEDVELYS